MVRNHFTEKILVYIIDLCGILHLIKHVAQNTVHFILIVGQIHTAVGLHTAGIGNSAHGGDALCLLSDDGLSQTLQFQISGVFEDVF